MFASGGLAVIKERHILSALERAANDRFVVLLKELFTTNYKTLIIRNSDNLKFPEW